VVTHPANRGKAAALRSGFQRAAELGFTHTITIDTDGQLDPKDMAQLWVKSLIEPTALVVGVRDDRQADYPTKSRIGRRVSNWLVSLESGVRIADSQCGLRVYPLDFVNSVRCTAEHYGFETEIITRAGWAGRKVIGEPVSCRYLPEEQRVSHFKPFVDSMRAVRMHARLATGAMARWFSPRSAWHQMRGDSTCRRRFAAGLAVGVFVANLPLYGMQTIVSLFLARRLRLHPLSVVAGSNVSIPPVAPLLIAGGIVTGHLVLHGSWLSPQGFNLSRAGVAGVVLPLLGDWIVGGIVLGAILAGITFLIATFALRVVTPGGATMQAAELEPTENRERKIIALPPGPTSISESPVSPTLYNLFRSIGRSLRYCTIRATVIGRGHAEGAGGKIIACSHFSHLDPFLVGLLLNRQVDWMTRIEFFKWRWARWLLPRLGAIPVNRQGVPVRAIRTAINRAAAGGLVGICPEGGVTLGPDSVCRGGAIKRGICLVAERADVPIVPCVLVGTHVMSKFEPWLPYRRIQIWIAFAEPIVPVSQGISTRGTRARLGAELQRRFEELYQQVLRESGINDRSIP
jgi:1-acyl-sn-glycerol-3-phosphate acyltransferase